jgi:hypothetical protein
MLASKNKLLQLSFFWFFSNKMQELKRKTIAKSKVKENLTKVKNLQLLPRQRRQKMFLMAATLFFKMPLFGTPRAE